MTATTTTPAPTTAAEDLPLRSITAYLAVDDAPRALEFYASAFGARRRGEPVVMDDGRIGHAELAVGDCVLMLADEFAEIGMLAPNTRGGPSQSLLLQVPDPDAAVERAVRAGAELTRPVADYPHGRNGVVVDPFGHRWMISGGAVASGRPQGHLGYASLWVPDVDRAAAFFATVLGWSYSGHGPEHRMVTASSPHHGIVAFSALPGGVWDTWPRHGTLFTSHAVEDVDAAVQRVRAAGGQAGQPSDEPYGRTASCVDDQGLPFAVHQDASSPKQAAASPGHGRLAYLTFEVTDSARARAFYATVFGWRFAPGNVADGWQIEGMTPMSGMHGGHEQPTIVPMYAVDDVRAAVSRVRGAGGTATDPEHQPYGTTSSCADDQGTRFYLGELG